MMPSLLTMLLDYDIELLTIIANRWDVDLETHNTREAAEKLAEAMLNADRAAYEWSRLSDQERGALQLVLGSRDHKMPLAQYSRLYKEIRLMGADRRTREKPHLAPLGMAEVLYYRGLIGLAYDQGAAGMQPFVFVPPDLSEVLPSHKTGYDLTTAEDAEDFDELEPPSQETTLTARADTTLIDDLATLLAYLQLAEAKRQGKTLSEIDRQAVGEYCLGRTDPARMALLVALAIDMGLTSDSHEGLLKPVPANARRWLDQPRTKQVQMLVEAWENSAVFNELEYVPNLILETASWRNDPSLIRKTLKSFLKKVPEDDWFSAAELIESIKKHEPDFQRPAADYESWYIRDADSGEYLKGFENWDRIDGAALYVALTKPIHWLGLADLGESEAGTMLRLTAYGRAFAGLAVYPEVPDTEAELTILGDGVIEASRNLSRYDRFQLARFTNWESAGEPFRYRLTGDSLARADKQGIKAEHIRTFLKRTSGEKVPPPILEMLDNWEKTGGVAVTLSRLNVLQTDNEAALDGILATPELRRFLGARLGGRAVVVRDGQWDDLVRELGARGIRIEQE